jgi:multimeric flavodoxin WrbA
MYRRRVPSLLIVHHTSSPSLQAMLEAVLAGAGTDEIVGVDVVVRPALAATAVDVLAVDGFVLGTSANIGYMSGALKHFFDLVYYPTLTAKTGAPYGLYVHGNSDTGGAVRAVEAITKGMGWQQVHDHVTVIGKPGKDDLDACWDLGATVAATLAEVS